MKNVIICLSIIIIMNIVVGKSKSLQVLDFESERDLKKYMKEISKDLGVKCTYCHDLNDKSIDTEHKIIAREMIKMQQGLNKDFFSQMGDSLQKQKNTLQITCWTCHHGNKNPQLFRPKE